MTGALWFFCMCCACVVNCSSSAVVARLRQPLPARSFSLDPLPDPMRPACAQSWMASASRRCTTPPSATARRGCRCGAAPTTARCAQRFLSCSVLGCWASLTPQSMPSLPTQDRQTLHSLTFSLSLHPTPTTVRVCRWRRCSSPAAAGWTARTRTAARPSTLRQVRSRSGWLARPPGRLPNSSVSTVEKLQEAPAAQSCFAAEGWHTTAPRAPCHLPPGAFPSVCAGAGALDILVRFIGLGGTACVDLPDSIGWTPLFWACNNGHGEAACSLAGVEAFSVAAVHVTAQSAQPD